ncbi:M15 family metallopeptidase [Marisediminicola sp. LYQ134]|uniref:M15 family metallopeptidase n=1 Tax=Marisediminicola sp. LYQ134 TaxID=3391061 RepID=UPI003982E79F
MTIAAVVLVSARFPASQDGGAHGFGATRTVDLGSLGDDDGYIRLGDSVSPFAEGLPAIDRLEPELRDAMEAAATDALADGLDFVVTSGWRSERYQQALFDDAVQLYGSEHEASHWVASATTSAHVRGQAVDIGYTDANSWLSQHGADYGLCQIYANEMWHFELATAPGGECPPQVPDASYA